MRCAIMQPTYLPWAGYFNLMANVDAFVFLDDAQFCRGTWHQRNRIVVDGEAKYITQPIFHSGVKNPINKTLLSEKKPNWMSEHRRVLNSSYAFSPYVKDIDAIFDGIDSGVALYLAEVNIRIIRKIAERLNLKCDFFLASELNVQGRRTARLLDICHKLHCDHYLTPVGALDYLQEDEFLAQNDIALDVQNFNPAVYPQANCSAFVSHLSIVDVIANCGWDGAAEYIRN